MNSSTRRTRYILSKCGGEFWNGFWQCHSTHEPCQVTRDQWLEACRTCGQGETDKSRLCAGFLASVCPTPLSARMHCMGLIFAPRPEPVNNYSLCSFPSRETIFSKTVLKNIAFSYAKIFHSLPPEKGMVFLLQLGVITFFLRPL